MVHMYMADIAMCLDWQSLVPWRLGYYDMCAPVTVTSYTKSHANTAPGTENALHFLDRHQQPIYGISY